MFRSHEKETVKKKKKKKGFVGSSESQMLNETSIELRSDWVGLDWDRRGCCRQLAVEEEKSNYERRKSTRSECSFLSQVRITWTSNNYMMFTVYCLGLYIK